MQPTTNSPFANLDGTLLNMRIITFALILGVSVFLGVVLFQGAWNKAPEGMHLSVIGALMAVLMISAQFAIPIIIRTPVELSNQPTDQQSLGLAFVHHIVRLALLEGAAFLNCLALMQEHNRWTAGVIAVLLVGMLLQWPSRTRLEQFLETRRMDDSLNS